MVNIMDELIKTESHQSLDEVGPRVMNESIKTVAELEAVVGKIPATMTLKVIDHLDDGALRWIASAPLMFACFGDVASIGITVAGGAPGFVPANTIELKLPLSHLDDPALARPGAGFGSLFLLPGVDETMRVNGSVTEIKDGYARVIIEECFGHCGKALIRSDFWRASPNEAPVGATDAVHASRFMALASLDAQGHGDLSPKGDPTGAMACLEDGKVWFADRPGNRRTDSFRNILTQPQVAAILLMPGSTQVIRLKGNAAITKDDAIRAHFIVQDKTPVLATAIDNLDMQIYESER
jgi:predicted pyridoxine 5'-phosphate oxidase superfamily flavin-nucleotide-binding protein